LRIDDEVEGQIVSVSWPPEIVSRWAGAVSGGAMIFSPSGQ